MQRLHIIGGKNHGKTKLVAELVAELRDRGLRVGTIKHTHHQHELDAPGKDSHRHREAGAAVVGILSRGMNAVIHPVKHDDRSTDCYGKILPMFTECDLVLVEGDLGADAPKIEVWRAATNTDLLAANDQSISAVVSPPVSHRTTRNAPRPVGVDRLCALATDEIAPYGANSA